MKNRLSLLHKSLFTFTPKIPMARYEPRVTDVLEDKTLIGKQVVNTPTNPRRNARGIVLRQKVSFSKGSYATLRNLKYFYKTVDGEKSPSNSLIIRRALDLLDATVSSMRDKSSMLIEYECLQSLIDPNYRSRRIRCK